MEASKASGFEGKLTRRANHGHSLIIAPSVNARRPAIAGGSVAIEAENSHPS